MTAAKKRSKAKAAPSAPAKAPARPPPVITRVQTGVRMEKRIVKVLKALAEYHDLSLGDLLEGVVLHAFEGKCPFDADSLERIARLREVYGLDLRASESHHLRESAGD